MPKVTKKETKVKVTKKLPKEPPIEDMAKVENVELIKEVDKIPETINLSNFTSENENIKKQIIKIPNKDIVVLRMLDKINTDVSTIKKDVQQILFYLNLELNEKC